MKIVYTDQPSILSHYPIVRSCFPLMSDNYNRETCL